MRELNNQDTSVLAAANAALGKVDAFLACVREAERYASMDVAGLLATGAEALHAAEDAFLTALGPVGGRLTIDEQDIRLGYRSGQFYLELPCGRGREVLLTRATYGQMVRACYKVRALWSACGGLALK